MIEINFSPPWFINLAQTSKALVSEFTSKFKNLTDESYLAPYLAHLIDIFGRANQNQIATFLPGLSAKKFKTQLVLRQERFSKLVKISLKDLSENRRLDLANLGEFYKVSALSS